MTLTREEIIALLIAEYGDLENYDLDKGICHNCGHIQSSGHSSSCEECKDKAVFGIEETIILIL